MSVQKINEVYKCSVCGNLVEVVGVGGGTLVCCGKEMIVQTENTSDGALEKHVPVVEINNDKIRVRIGEVAHPMEDSHYIEWIEVISGGRSYKVFLNPGDLPEAEFCVADFNGDLIVREYCNLHGLWKK